MPVVIECIVLWWLVVALSLFVSARHLEMLLLSSVLGCISHTETASTGWIVTYQVIIAGFTSLNTLKDCVLSISLCYEHIFHHTRVTTCPLFVDVKESWQQLVSKQTNVSLSIWHPDISLVLPLLLSLCRGKGPWTDVERVTVQSK